MTSNELGILAAIVGPTAVMVIINYYWRAWCRNCETRLAIERFKVLRAEHYLNAQEIEKEVLSRLAVLEYQTFLDAPYQPTPAELARIHVGLNRIRRTHPKDDRLMALLDRRAEMEYEIVSTDYQVK